MNEFGERLKELRENQNLTEAQLAKMLGCGSNHIYSYEDGCTMPGLLKLRQLKKLFGCSWFELLGE